MKLKEWDANAQRFIEREYPDSLIKPFVDWMRGSKQWRESDDGDRRVYWKFIDFEKELTRFRNDQAMAQAVAPETCSGETAAGTRCKRTTGLVDGRCRSHQLVAV